MTEEISKTEETLNIKSNLFYRHHRIIGTCFIILGVILGTISLNKISIKIPEPLSPAVLSELKEQVVPKEGKSLPVSWSDIGRQLVSSGVIDSAKFEELYSTRGGITKETRELLFSEKNGRLVINEDNANVILNLLWAFGLANKNEILEKGPMADPKYGGAGNFASTGGWTLSRGDPMDHYSHHAIIKLTPEQQDLVERVSSNIYRPCCPNSTYFPDCNHGLAMLGLLQLMVAQGVSEEEMYKAALTVNSYWFPDTYMTIAQLIWSEGIEWSNSPAKKILGSQYSSAEGFQRVKNLVAPIPNRSNNSCGA